MRLRIKGIVFVIFWLVTSCNTYQKSISSTESNSFQNKVLLNKNGKPKSIIPYVEWVYLKPEVADWDMKYGSFSQDSIRLNIGIFDKNNNGEFFDFGNDIIFIGSGSDSSFAYTPAFSSRAALIKPVITLNYNDERFFEIKNENQSDLVIEIFETGIEDFDLIYYNRIPDIELEFLDSNLEKINLRSFKNGKRTKYIFWAPWCSPCIQEMDQIMETKEYESLNIVSLFVDGNLKIAQEIVEKKDYPWLFLQSSSKINRAFSQNGLPFVVKFDEYGYMIK